MEITTAELPSFEAFCAFQNKVVRLFRTIVLPDYVHAQFSPVHCGETPQPGMDSTGGHFRACPPCVCEHRAGRAPSQVQQTMLHGFLTWLRKSERESGPLTG